MAAFNVPATTARSTLMIDKFYGVDFTNRPTAVSEYMSPNCINMIRDVPGKVRKCMGYQTIKTYPDKINGYHTLVKKDDTSTVVHSGNCLYMGESLLYDDCADVRSRSFQFGNMLYIIDGKKMLCFDGTTIRPATEGAYIPTVTIAKAPKGGGTQYESLNLLQSGFTEGFAGTEGDTAYFLTFGNLDSTAVEVEVMDNSGNMVVLTEGSDFTVDRLNGIVNFMVAPGESPVTGEDNVFITAYRTVDGYADRINKCTIGIEYGVNGEKDRLFLSGNEEYRNYEWYSDLNNPTYFPDTNYCVLGISQSAIVGYSFINNYLAVHKDEYEINQGIFIQEGALNNGEAVFVIVNSLQGESAIARDAFAYLGNEPLFLTNEGVYAITAQDVTGEKYAQCRSFYVNGRLLNEENLEDAIACVHNNMYWLCINDVVYILDGLQPLPPVENMPYATRQYACFYRDNVPANCIWEFDGELYFGTRDGRICKFYSGKYDAESYSDDGEPIQAIWETADFDGNQFYKKKTFKYFALRMHSACDTSVKVYYYKNNGWAFILENFFKAAILSFSRLQFSNFSFISYPKEKLITSKLRIKKVDKVRFRFMNNVLNEPFFINNVAFEFVEKGNYKGG